MGMSGWFVWLLGIGLGIGLGLGLKNRFVVVVVVVVVMEKLEGVGRGECRDIDGNQGKSSSSLLVIACYMTQKDTNKYHHAKPSGRRGERPGAEPARSF